MTRSLPAVLGATLASFAAGLGTFAIVRGGEPAPRAAAESRIALPSATTDERIAVLTGAVRDRPESTTLPVLLADSYLQKIRETGDPSLYPKVEALIDGVLRRAPGDAGALTMRGTLRLSRHDFRGGLADARAARRVAPDVVKPFGVMVDGLVELGRYAEAGRTVQRFVDLKPGLSSYTRASYFRELHGDLAGATEALRLADAAGGDSAENTAYVQSLLGHVWFVRGRLEKAGRAYREAAARFPGFGPAQVGLARVMAARGDLAGAEGILRREAARAPGPDNLVLLAELERVRGADASARDHVREALKLERFERTKGVNVGADLALLEAQYGSPARAVRLGRAGWRNAPSVRSADALGWALTRAGRPAAGLAWARRALRLGTLQPEWLYHAGIAALQSGHGAAARRYLIKALSLNPRFSPLLAPRAQRALATVS